MASDSAPASIKTSSSEDSEKTSNEVEADNIVLSHGLHSSPEFCLTEVNNTSTESCDQKDTMPRLPSPDLADIFDLIVVGFGPSALALAIAMQDELERTQIPAFYSLGRHPKVLFLEKKPHFAWHSGMLLDNAKMQISFLKDMATLRNPRSRFTFVNYLYEKQRLVQFSNLNTFLPSRIEFEDYMRWCAEHFRHVVKYDCEAVAMEPDKLAEITGGKGMVKTFKVIYEYRKGGLTGLHGIKTRHVVINIGGTPSIPSAFFHPRDPLNATFSTNAGRLLSQNILHSSRYTNWIPELTSAPSTTSQYRQHLSEGVNPAKTWPSRKVAVIGSGQSAAEIFYDLATRLSALSLQTPIHTEVHLLFRGSALKPSDDSPFVNELFDPARIDPFHASSEELRREHLEENRNTNYGVVRQDLLEKIYDMMYQQRVKDAATPKRLDRHDRDQSKCRLRIIPGASVASVQIRESGQIHLGVNWVPHAGLIYSDNNSDRLKHGGGGSSDALDRVHSRHDGFDYDHVILATGYDHTLWKTLLRPVFAAAVKPAAASLAEPGRDLVYTSASSALNPGVCTVARDYRLTVRGLWVSRSAGIWLQGCNEETHGLSDSLLSALAVRAGQLVKSLFDIVESPASPDEDRIRE